MNPLRAHRQRPRHVPATRPTKPRSRSQCTPAKPQHLQAQRASLNALTDKATLGRRSAGCRATTTIRRCNAARVNAHGERHAVVICHRPARHRRSSRTGCHIAGVADPDFAEEQAMDAPRAKAASARATHGLTAPRTADIVPVSIALEPRRTSSRVVLASPILEGRRIPFGFALGHFNVVSLHTVSLLREHSPMEQAQPQAKSDQRLR